MATATVAAAAAELRLWYSGRDGPERVLFVVASLGAAATALLEVRLIHVTTPEDFQAVVRLMYASMTVANIAIAWFAVTYLRQGPLWPIWVFTLVRAALLVPNFTGPGNATFLDVAAVEQVEFFGQTVAVAVATDSPWRTVTKVNTLLLAVFVAVASVFAHRNRTREHALAFGGVLLGTIVLSVTVSLAGGTGARPGPLQSLGVVVILVPAYVLLGLDLSRSVSLAHALAESGRRMARAADAARITLWEWNSTNGSLWRQDPGSDDRGLRPPTTTSLADFLDTVHADDRDRVREGITRSVTAGGTLEEVYRAPEREGRTRWWSIAGGVEEDSGRGEAILRGAARDVTERVGAEQELEVHRLALARAERTTTLSHLSAGLAHELRQPLGSILGLTDATQILLDRGRLDPVELRAIVEELRSEVARANDVASRVRDLSAARPAAQEPVEMRRLVERTTELLRSESRRLSIRVETDLAPGLSPILGDRVLLQQVLLNLMMNAFEAVADVESGTGTVRVSCRSAGPGLQLLEVVDSGPGVPREVMDRLFEPFYTTKRDGSGLGLWIARSIIERHGGELVLGSALPGATTLQAFLPEAPARV